MISSKYVKKPVVIEAVLWTGNNAQIPDIMDWISDSGGRSDFALDPKHGKALFIHTLEGEMAALPGDYIIKGIKGEFYPCKPDIFEASYDMAEND